MALELGFVDGDVLDGHGPLTRLMFDHPIHKSKWIAVGQQIEDLLTGQQRGAGERNGQRASGRSELSSQGRRQSGVQPMGPAEGKDLGSGQTHQRQVAQQVQQLMAHRFLLESQRGIQPLPPIADQGIAEIPTFDQPGRLKLLHLFAKAEGAGRGDLLNETPGVSSREKSCRPIAGWENSMAAPIQGWALGRAVTKLWPC